MPWIFLFYIHLNSRPQRAPSNIYWTPWAPWTFFEHHSIFYFNHRKTSIHKSTEVNLLSCLICLSGKMADWALWLVRSPVNQALWERSVVKASQSDCSLRYCALYRVCGLLFCICQVFYLDGQIAVFAGGGHLLDVSVHLRHGQTACALLAAAEDALQPRQNPLQLWVQVTAVIWNNTHISVNFNFFFSFWGH